MELICSNCGKEIESPTSSKTEPCPHCNVMMFMPSRKLFEDMRSNSYLNME